MSRPGPGRGRRSQSERVAESERALLAAAIELICEQGYGRTTAAQIGERAGYSRSMVRERYGSNEALLGRLLTDEAQRRIAQHWPTGMSGIDRMVGLVERLRSELAADPMTLRALHVVAYEAVAGVPELVTWTPGWFAQCQCEAEAALEVGLRDGSIRADLDIAAEARRFINYGLGIAFRWTMEQNDELFDAELRDWAEDTRLELTPVGDLSMSAPSVR